MARTVIEMVVFDDDPDAIVVSIRPRKGVPRRFGRCGRWVPWARHGVLAFPDKAAATAWWNDPDYQKIAEDRRAGTTPYVISVIGERPDRWTGD